MTAVEPTTAAYRQAEHHRFAVTSAEFLYLVPSGAIFGLNGLSQDIFDLLSEDPALARGAGGSAFAQRLRSGGS